MFGTAQAQPSPVSFANRRLASVRCSEAIPPPTIDGELQEPSWKMGAKAETFVDPQTSKPVSDQTEVYVLYDNEFIYVGFYCHDSQPDGIVGRETVRDADLRNDDTVRVEFDPFLTYKFDDYTIFTVNPLGTQHIRQGGGRAGKLEWQGAWSAAAKRVADGWTAEMRIPWSILSYPRSRQPIHIGINFRRNQYRTQITSFWSDLGPQRFNDRQGIWQSVQPPVQAWRPRFSALPYLMPSLQISGGRSQNRVGMDARYQPTPELTAVATLNPDFASVEGAIEGINFSRSERFVPERRPFFLEGQDYLGLGEFYQIGAMFNPVRIGQFDGGAKVYGKLTPRTTIGTLGTYAVGKQTNFATQIRQEFGPTSNASLLLLQRLAPGEDNTVIALSPYARKGKWSVDAQAIQTLGPEAGGAAWTSALSLEDKNLFATLRYRSVAPNFRNRLGFIPFVDYKGWSSYVNWNNQWRKGYFRSFSLDVFPEWDQRNDGSPFRRQMNMNFEIETRSDYRFGFSVGGGKFERQSDFTYGFTLGRGVTNRFRRWEIGMITGQQADRPFTALTPSFSFRLGKKFDVSYSSYLQSYEGFSQQHIATFNYEIDPFRSWGGRLVVQDSAVNFYLSYRNAGRRGMDTYFIIGDPNARSFVQRVMVKFVFAY
jgi:hypothetical protein